MTGATLSVDGLIIGGLFIVFLFTVFEFVKMHVKSQSRVFNTKQEIISNALWEYHDSYERPMKEVKHEPTFSEQLENNAKSKFFNKRKNK